MREKDLTISEYLDIYGNVLDEKQRQIIDMYYNEDYSLSEISEICDMTRQGAGESIKKSVKRLMLLESQLGLLEKKKAFGEKRDCLVALAKRASVADHFEKDKLLRQLICEIDELSI